MLDITLLRKDLAAAVAMAESGGFEQAVGDSGTSFVTRFDIRSDFLANYRNEEAGGGPRHVQRRDRRRDRRDTQLPLGFPHLDQRHARLHRRAEGRRRADRLLPRPNAPKARAMSKTPQAIRGTQDIFGADSEAFAFVVETFERVRKLYRFRRAEMPVFEKTEVFSRAIGETTDVVSKEMYSFDDRGGESLTLRPEFTAGIARAFLSNGWQQHAQIGRA